MDWKIFLTGGGAGATLGYLGRLFSEPITNEVNGWRRRRLLRRTLYEELATNYGWLTAFLEPERLSLLEHRFAENIREHASLQVYEHALENKELFFGLKERGVITEINTALKKLLEMDPKQMPGYEFVPFAALMGKQLISNIEGAVISARLSLRFIEKVTPAVGKKLSDIKTGKVRRTSEIYDEIEKRLTDEVVELLKVPPPPVP